MGISSSGGPTGMAPVTLYLFIRECSCSNPSIKGCVMVFLPAWSFTCCWKLEATVCWKDRIKVLPASSARKNNQSSVKRVFLVKVSAPPPSKAFTTRFRGRMWVEPRLTHRLFITWTHGRQSLNRGCLNLPVSPPRPPTR